MDAQELGQQLSAMREARDLTIEEVEQQTRIRSKFLAAFESGNYEDLPRGPQSRGFLQNYARFLRLDEDEILAAYDAILAQAAKRARRRHKPRRSQNQPPEMTPVVYSDEFDALEAAAAANALDGGRRSRWGRLRTFVVLVLAVVTLAVVCAGTLLLAEQLLTEVAQQSGVDLLEALPTIPTATASSTFLPSSTPLPGQEVVNLGPVITDSVVLDVSVTERVWMEVEIDGEMDYQGVTAPGTAFQFTGVEVVVLRATSASALSVVFNNIPLGVLGERGQPYSRAFTPEQALTPTVPPSATPPPTQAATQAPSLLPPLAATQDGSPAAVDDGLEAGLPTLDLNATPTSLPSFGQETPATPGEGDGLGATPTLAPVTGSPPPTSTATLTETPSPTQTPSPTVILPPRNTATPAQEKPQL